MMDSEQDIDWVAYFKYRVQPTEVHNELMEKVTYYYQENEKFMKYKNRAAGKRARKALLEIFHLVRARRAEIQDTVNKFEYGEWR
jgi:hypothetical protein